MSYSIISPNQRPQSALNDASIARNLAIQARLFEPVYRSVPSNSSLKLATFLSSIESHSHSDPPSFPSTSQHASHRIRPTVTGIPTLDTDRLLDTLRLSSNASAGLPHPSTQPTRNLSAASLRMTRPASASAVTAHVPSHSTPPIRMSAEALVHHLANSVVVSSPANTSVSPPSVSAAAALIRGLQQDALYMERTVHPTSRYQQKVSQASTSPIFERRNRPSTAMAAVSHTASLHQRQVNIPPHRKPLATTNYRYLDTPVKETNDSLRPANSLALQTPVLQLDTSYTGPTRHSTTKIRPQSALVTNPSHSLEATYPIQRIEKRITRQTNTNSKSSVKYNSNSGFANADSDLSLLIIEDLDEDSNTPPHSPIPSLHLIEPLKSHQVSTMASPEKDINLEPRPSTAPATKIIEPPTSLVTTTITTTKHNPFFDKSAFITEVRITATSKAPSLDLPVSSELSQSESHLSAVEPKFVQPTHAAHVDDSENVDPRPVFSDTFSKLAKVPISVPRTEPISGLGKSSSMPQIRIANAAAKKLEFESRLALPLEGCEFDGSGQAYTRDLPRNRADSLKLENSLDEQLIALHAEFPAQFIQLMLRHKIAADPLKGQATSVPFIDGRIGSALKGKPSRVRPVAAVRPHWSHRVPPPQQTNSFSTFSTGTDSTLSSDALANLLGRVNGLYDEAFRELIRQVSGSCREQGVVLERLVTEFVQPLHQLCQELLSQDDRDDNDESYLCTQKLHVSLPNRIPSCVSGASPIGTPMIDNTPVMKGVLVKPISSSGVSIQRPILGRSSSIFMDTNYIERNLSNISNTTTSLGNVHQALVCDVPYRLIQQVSGVERLITSLELRSHRATLTPHQTVQIISESDQHVIREAGQQFIAFRHELERQMVYHTTVLLDESQRDRQVRRVLLELEAIKSKQNTDQSELMEQLCLDILLLASARCSTSMLMASNKDTPCPVVLFGATGLMLDAVFAIRKAAFAIAHSVPVLLGFAQDCLSRVLQSRTSGNYCLDERGQFVLRGIGVTTPIGILTQLPQQLGYHHTHIEPIAVGKDSGPALIPLSRARRGSFGATDMASIVHYAVLQESLNSAPIPDRRSSGSQKDNSVLGSDNPITNIEVSMSRAGVLSRLSKISGSQEHLTLPKSGIPAFSPNVDPTELEQARNISAMEMLSNALQLGRNVCPVDLAMSLKRNSDVNTTDTAQTAKSLRNAAEDMQNTMDVLKTLSSQLSLPLSMFHLGVHNTLARLLCSRDLQLTHGEEWTLPFTLAFVNLFLEKKMRTDAMLLTVAREIPPIDISLFEFFLQIGDSDIRSCEKLLQLMTALRRWKPLNARLALFSNFIGLDPAESYPHNAHMNFYLAVATQLYLVMMQPCFETSAPLTLDWISMKRLLLDLTLKVTQEGIWCIETGAENSPPSMNQLLRTPTSDFVSAELNPVVALISGVACHPRQLVVMAAALRSVAPGGIDTVGPLGNAVSVIVDRAASVKRFQQVFSDKLKTLLEGESTLVERGIISVSPGRQVKTVVFDSLMPLVMEVFNAAVQIDQSNFSEIYHSFVAPGSRFGVNSLGEVLMQSSGATSLTDSQCVSLYRDIIGSTLGSPYPQFAQVADCMRMAKLSPVFTTNISPNSDHTTLCKATEFLIFERVVELFLPSIQYKLDLFLLVNPKLHVKTSYLLTTILQSIEQRTATCTIPLWRSFREIMDTLAFVKIPSNMYYSSNVD